MKWYNPEMEPLACLKYLIRYSTHGTLLITRGTLLITYGTLLNTHGTLRTADGRRDTI